MKIQFLLIAALTLMTSSFANAATEVANRDQLRQKFGLEAYEPGAALETLKIAILDNGFQGYAPGKGLLPESAELIEGTHNPQSPTNHGLGMAQIVWAMTGQSAAGPKFYLVNTNGFSNLKTAVDFVIAQKVDIVLYSQVWSFGDNFDGKGFINALVNKATSAGVLWINATGNFGGMVYNGNVLARENTSDHFMNYKTGFDYLRFENKLDENDATITLTWTDFQDTETYNAVKDLDIFVYDENEKLVGSSQLIQKGVAPPSDGKPSQLSSYARETVSLSSLDRGTYHIKVLDKSNNFVSTDRFRVLIDVSRPETIVFTDHTIGYELMPPADNASVFTVGEQTEVSSVGPTLAGLNKPDAVIDDATIAFTNGEVTQGSSNAAAIMTGIVAEMKATNSNLNLATLTNYAAQLGGASTADLHPVAMQVNPKIVSWIPKGGKIMFAQNNHLVILSPVDPLTLPIFKNQNAYRKLPTDVLMISVLDDKWYGAPAAQEATIGAPYVEFRQIQRGTWITPAPSWTQGR
jgi:hypothetical protein